jgi:hypothetical protein
LLQRVTADIATSDAVKIAKQVDPNFDRTIGVLTKVDIMDKGTEYEARELIQGEDKNFPKVWIPVKNRCHADIYVNKTMEEHRQEEHEFFEQWFKDLSWEEDRCGVGIECMCRTLEVRFSDCLREKMPLIESDIKRMLKQKVSELETWKLERDPSFWKTKAITSMHGYCQRLEQVLDGRGDHAPNTLNVGARVVRLYRSDFLRQVQSLDPLQDYRDTDCLQTLIENSRGQSNGIFLPNEALKRVVRENVDKLLPICQRLVDAVRRELEEQIVFMTMDGINKGFEIWVQRQAICMVNKWAEDCSQFVDVLVNMEKQINRDHPIHPLRLEDINNLDHATSDSSANPNMASTTLSYDLTSSQHGIPPHKKKKKMKTPFNIASSMKKKLSDEESVAAFGKEDQFLDEIQPAASSEAIGASTQNCGGEDLREGGVKDDNYPIDRIGSDEETVQRGSAFRDAKDPTVFGSQLGAFLTCHGVRDAMLGGHQFEEIQIVRVLLKKVRV